MEQCKNGEAVSKDRDFRRKGKLIFNHGTMFSKKSAMLLMDGDNHELQGKTALYFRPALDNRGSDGKIESRVNVNSKDCTMLSITDRVYDFLKVAYENNLEQGNRVSKVSVDEAQFLTADQVRGLSDFVDDYGVDVICWGLKNSYIRGKLFEGSKALLYYADEINEIKTSCQFCDEDAKMNLLVQNGKPIYKGDSPVIIGDVADRNETPDDMEQVYIQTCRLHYNHPPINKQ